MASPPPAWRASRCSSRRSTASTRSAIDARSPRPTGPSPALADVHVAISAGLARYLAENEGFDASAFEVVHYGIEPGLAPPPPPGEPRLAIVGRLIPIKGHEVLLEALRLVREEVPELTLEIAGDGPLESQLRATVARLGLAESRHVPRQGRPAGAGVRACRDRRRALVRRGVRHGRARGDGARPGRDRERRRGSPRDRRSGRDGPRRAVGRPRFALAGAIAELARDPARAAAFGAAGRERALSAFSQERCTEQTERSTWRRSRGLSGEWSRWMARGTCREARTQGASICVHIDATEDAASRCVTPAAALSHFPDRPLTGVRRRSRTSSQARSSANAASSASRKSHGAR